MKDERSHPPGQGRSAGGARPARKAPIMLSPGHSSTRTQPPKLAPSRPHRPIVGKRRHNLPAQPTPLIGRQREVEAAQRLLRADRRLLTLTGPPGVGKTRLALAVAAELLDEFEHGVLFVDLAPIGDPALVAYTITKTLGVREARDQSPFERLKHYLRDKQMLLLLDNFEQVIAAASQVADLLSACSELKILVTSRAGLRVRWEQEFPVLPLGLPDLKQLPSADALSEYPAIALLIERARAVNPEFVLSDQNGPTVAEICTRLDGLPLAIELTAAHIKSLPPQVILQRLQHRLMLLASGPPDLPVRHQTLRGAIAWSYDLLRPDEQRLFRRLSVFVGGSTVEAVEAVCGGEGDLNTDVLEGLAALVDKNLLRQDSQLEGEARFWMLETIREYALERLTMSRESEGIQRRHAAFFLSFAEGAEGELHGSKQAVWLDRLEREHGNMRAVLRWALEAGEIETALRLSGALWWVWEQRGHLAEGQRWLEEALSRSAAVAPAIRAKALNGAGCLARDRGDYRRAMASHEECLALRRGLGDKRRIASTLNNLANVLADQGNYGAARALHEESLNLYRELGDRRGTAYLLDNLAGDLSYQGDNERATALHEESLAVHRELGDRHGMATVLNNLGVAARDRGDYKRAKAFHEESLALYQELRDQGGVALALVHLGLLARYQGDHMGATALCKESLALFWEVEDKRRIAKGLGALAGVIAAKGQADQAAQLFGAEEALRDAIGAPLPPSDRRDYDRDVKSVRARLGKKAFAAAWTAGRAQSLEKAVEYALGVVASAPPTAEAERRPTPLTPREEEVAGLIARGFANREIATALGITEGTVEVHVQHILNKLGFHSRAQIAVWVVEHGLVKSSRTE